MTNFEVYKKGSEKPLILKIKEGQKVSKFPTKQIIFDLLKGKKGEYEIKELLIIN